ncbi:MAG: hypothetical protein IIA87_03215 [Nanoarchaeota archaeon]|nr:hypothetical protein [Nanoarchaeota archaeon]
MAQNEWKIWALLVIGLFISATLAFGWFSPAVESISEKVIITGVLSGIVFPEYEAPDTSKIDEIHTKILEDDAWEVEIEKLATEEWSERDNKDLFRAINDFYGDLDDESDIIYVREDESTTFNGLDTNDKDGVVTQFLKIKYEDDSGDNQKVYITVVTTFDDGDLEDQEFFETE